MLALGAHLGAEVWWCERIFALTGGWVPTTAEVGVRLHLAEVSRVAGEHARTLRGHLPRPAPVDPADWVRPPTERAVALVADLEPTTAAAERLAVVHRVLLTWLLSAWDRPRPATSAGPTRVIGHARGDLGELRREGEALLEALLVADPTTVRGVHEVTGRCEATLVAAGGIHPPEPHRIPPDR